VSSTSVANGALPVLYPAGPSPTAANPAESAGNPAAATVRKHRLVGM